MRPTIRQTLVKSIGALAITLVGVAGTAHAAPMLSLGDTVQVTGESETTGDTAFITFAGLPGGQTLDVYTAPVTLTGSVNGIAFNDLLAYCTDLYNYSATPAIYTVGTLTSSHQPSGAADLSTTQVNNIATLIKNDWKGDQAATQLAIWAVEYGDAFSFSNASGNTAADEAYDISMLDGSVPQGVEMVQLQHDGVQGFAVVQDVPEPFSMAVLGVGLLGLGYVRSRRA